jgi:hypothetical protein
VSFASLAALAALAFLVWAALAASVAAAAASSFDFASALAVSNWIPRSAALTAAFCLRSSARATSWSVFAAASALPRTIQSALAVDSRQSADRANTCLWDARKINRLRVKACSRVRPLGGNIGDLVFRAARRRRTRPVASCVPRPIATSLTSFDFRAAMRVPSSGEIS